MTQERMTSRERLRAALRHEEADRIPIDLGGFQAGIHLKSYRSLIRRLGFETGAKIRYRTCGSCTQFIPDLIDNGIDILNPIQTGARNMDAAIKYGAYS